MDAKVVAPPTEQPKPKEDALARRMKLLDQLREEMPEYNEQWDKLRQKTLKKYNPAGAPEGEIYQPGEEPIHLQILNKLKGK